MKTQGWVLLSHHLHYPRTWRKPPLRVGYLGCQPSPPAPSLTPPWRGTAVTIAFYTSALLSRVPALLCKENQQSKPRHDPKQLYPSRPTFLPVYAVQISPYPHPQHGQINVAFQSWLTSSDPRILLDIQICLAQQQDMTCTWKGVGGHLGLEPRPKPASSGYN